MKRTLATLCAGLTLAVAVPHAAWAGVENVGYFTRNPAASAPEGGIQVANAPDGRVSYGAISVFEDADTITSATLTLKESAGNGQNVNAASAKLVACPAAGTFKAGKGTLTDGPKADCTVGSVPLARDATGTWTGEVSSVLQGEPAAVAIVPAEGSGVFQVTFNPPDLLVVADESTGGGESSIDSSFDASEFGGTAGGDDSSSSGSSSSSSSFDSGEFSSGSSSGSSSSTLDSGSSSFGPSGSGTTFGTSSPSVAPQATFAAPVEAPPIDGTPAVSGETAAAPTGPTRQRFAGTPASTTSSGNAGVQFVFFVVVAAVIGTGAGFARNRLVTAKAG